MQMTSSAFKRCKRDVFRTPSLEPTVHSDISYHIFCNPMILECEDNKYPRGSGPQRVDASTLLTALFVAV